MSEYVVCTGAGFHDVRDVEKCVNEHLAKGFKLHGSMTTQFRTYMNDARLVQPMVKPPQKCYIQI